MSVPGDRSPSVIPRTILIVDDEPAATKLCKTALRETGYRVLDAEGSSDALKICVQHEGPIDLLLTDLILPPPGFQLASGSNQFPHVHGHELALRAGAIRKDIRIILMSENPEMELAARGIRRNVWPILAKPFGKEDLISLVRNVFEQPPPTFDLSEQGEAAKDAEWFG